VSVVGNFKWIRIGGDGVSGDNGAVQNLQCKALAALGRGKHMVTLTDPRERSPDVKSVVVQFEKINLRVALNTEPGAVEPV